MRKSFVKFRYKKGDVLNYFTFVTFDKFNDHGNKFSIWKCRCGKEKSIRDAEIRRNKTKSCGCLINSKANVHGDSGSSLNNGRHYLYKCHDGIKQRCTNPNNKRYFSYGGRGISFYSEWMDNYPLFKKYILDNLGERPKGYSLDRINNDGNYEPGNLRWASYKEQNNNQQKDTNV